RIINALKKSGFHATFFYVGDWITRAGAGGNAEVQYAFESGMEIANHTKTHPYLSRLGSEAAIKSEADSTHAQLKSIIGAEPSRLLRLPYLDYNSQVQSALKDYPLITDRVDTQDWNKASKDQIVSTLKGAMNTNLNGAIVLCHETYDSTASAMEEILPYLKSQGWQVVTISEMFAVKGKQLVGGQVYTGC
ncbi:MAG TPA: hypothetical protein DCZ71_03950, partial [Ruminococcus sp.]|nr:hypothetical protein [Ruminococcus sp.]